MSVALVDGAPSFKRNGLAPSRDQNVLQFLAQGSSEGFDLLLICGF